jgi:thiamine biosynthesis lipoprotein
MAVEQRFRAMGSDAHFVVVGGPSGLLEAARRRVEQLEQRWSRFLPDSEINQLNRWAGHPVAVSPDTITLIEHAVVAWRLSGGAFDPTVLGAVIRSGYDRSFEHLIPGAAGGHSCLGLGADAIVIGRETVTLPAGTGFDAGGIGKGLAADLISAEIMAAGADGVCINLGGDVKVTGHGPSSASFDAGAWGGGDGWTIAVEHPWSPAPLVRVGLVAGAIATSTTLRRRWHSSGGPRHHLIDPQTGVPSDTDLNLATVIAATGWMAEVLAKGVLLAGSAHPFDLLGGTGAQALAVDEHGHVQATAGLAGYLGTTPAPAMVPMPVGQAAAR